MLPKGGERVIVVGAGASGMLAAMAAAESGASVCILEKTDGPGKKLLLTGNGRCNFSNEKEMGDFIGAFGENGRFLYPAFSRFFREDMVRLLESSGVSHVIEPDGRLFPASGDSRDVLRALRNRLLKLGVQIETGARVTGLYLHGATVAGVLTPMGTRESRAVVLATGGASYPSTGSSGDGYRIAARAGHSIVSLRPALVPLAVSDAETVSILQGTSLPVRLSVYACPAEQVPQNSLPSVEYGRGVPGRRPRRPLVASRRGDIMFTHYGISGPVTLAVSLEVVDALAGGPVSVAVDFLPDVPAEDFAAALRSALQSGRGRRCGSIIAGFHLPARVVELILRSAGIQHECRASEVGICESEILVRKTKSFALNIKSPLPLSAAMVTAGGISLKEVDPRSMASRILKGLFVCGEVLDLDGETGGYNLQAAFSTGFLAGCSAAQYQPG